MKNQWTKNIQGMYYNCNVVSLLSLYGCSFTFPLFIRILSLVVLLILSRFILNEKELLENVSIT